MSENKKEQEQKESEVEKLKKSLKECEQQKEEYLRGWQRERADFLNYKKEEMERFKKILTTANENFILEILPILDNFEMAEKEIPKEKKEKDEFLKGLLQIKTQLKDFLKKQGVEEIKCVGEKFDPRFHEVIEEVELKDKESGIVIEEIKKGYKLQDKVLRPAKVKVVK